VTIVFLPLDQDCQCFAPGLAVPEPHCQNCQELLAADCLPTHSALQHLLALEQYAIPRALGLILLNGAWQACLADLVAQKLDVASRLASVSPLMPMAWQQMALSLQNALRPIPVAELTPVIAAIGAWGCEYLRLRPHLSYSRPGQSPQDFHPDLLTAVVSKTADLANGLTQVYRQVFQARYLLVWQQQGVNPLELGVEILIQPVVSGIAAGWLEQNGNTWQITAVTGLEESLSQGRVCPDRYLLDGATFSLHQSQLGQKTHAYSLIPGQGPTITPLPAAVAQEFVLSSNHLLHLGRLGQKLAGLEAAARWRYGWQIPADTNQAEITHLSSIPVDINHASQQLHLRDIGHGTVTTPGQALATALVIPPNEPAPDFSQHPPGFILVVSQFQPEWGPGLRAAAGLICEQGGITSHGAILARELGRPAVIGVPGITSHIESGQLIYLDGHTGRIAAVTAITPLAHAVTRPSPPPDRSAPPITAPLSHCPRLYVNLSQAESLSHLPPVPIAGIGLLRSEPLFLELLAGKHPLRWFEENRQAQLQEQFYQALTPFFAAFSPRPIFYRSLDLRVHEVRGLVGGSDYEAASLNPVLGVRGLARSCLHPEIFQLELRVLRQLIQHYPGPVRLILPFVRRIEEIIFCQEQLALLDLGGPDFQVWVMAEVPAMLFMLPDLPGLGVAGIAIGSNDLTQLLLGVDREQPTLAQQFNERHPAVKAAITQLIRTAQHLGLACSLCGEAASVYPDWVAWLAGLGIDSLSVTPEALTQAWNILQKLEPQPTLDPLRHSAPNSSS